MKKKRLFTLRILLKLITFIDFLEDVPQKTLKFLVKTTLLAVVSAFFLGVLFLELETKSVSLLARYLLIPENRAVSSKIEIKQNTPVLVRHLQFPYVSAKAFIALDRTTGVVLAQKNATTQLPPASTTKLITAMVALNIYALDESLVVPFSCTTINSQKAGFYAEEVVSVKDLLGTMLVTSAGDAACTLANGKISYGRFVALMNKKAYDLGAVDTILANPIGFDDIYAGHYSTAADLVKIALAATENKYIRELVASPEYTSHSGQFSRTYLNTNLLLHELEGSVGIKTGTTAEAGEVLIYEYHKDAKDIVIVVMGSEQRFVDTENILQWVLESYEFAGAAASPASM